MEGIVTLSTTFNCDVHYGRLSVLWSHLFGFVFLCTLTYAFPVLIKFNNSDIFLPARGPLRSDAAAAARPPTSSVVIGVNGICLLCLEDKDFLSCRSPNTYHLLLFLWRDGSAVAWLEHNVILGGTKSGYQKTKCEDRLTQTCQWHIISAATHLHLNNDNCLECIMIKGDIKSLKFHFVDVI